MLRNLCGSVPLWQSPYAKMKSDLISGCGSDWQPGQARNVTESSARIVCAGS